MFPTEIIDYIINLGDISTLKHTLLISSKYKNKAETLIVDEIFSERPDILYCIDTGYMSINSFETTMRYDYFTYDYTFDEFWLYHEFSLIGNNIKQHHEHIEEDESTCAYDLCYNIMNIDKEKCKLVGEYGTLSLYKQSIIKICKKYNLPHYFIDITLQFTINKIKNSMTRLAFVLYLRMNAHIGICMFADGELRIKCKKIIDFIDFRINNNNYEFNDKEITDLLII